MDTPNTILVTYSRLVELAHAEAAAIGNRDVWLHAHWTPPAATCDLRGEIRRSRNMRPSDLSNEDRFLTLAADATAFACPDQVQLQNRHGELAYVL